MGDVIDAHDLGVAGGYIIETSMQGDIDKLKDDNAKLRELCKTLYQLADESYVPFKSANCWMDDFAKAICAMRELGIEVDE